MAATTYDNVVEQRDSNYRRRLDKSFRHNGILAAWRRVPARMVMRNNHGMRAPADGVQSFLNLPEHVHRMLLSKRWLTLP